ncbi:MAG: leucine-rich repeat domain-containing protein [Oscillospiraceae bacterium]|jgi:hypothetical protein|nr:leucine-rich repeat domain-containing protein [Oscillospiraceae bacterium]
MKNVCKTILALVLVACVSMSICAIAENEGAGSPNQSPFFKVEIPEANLRLALPASWGGYPVERDDDLQEYVFYDTESAAEQPIFLLTILPKEGEWSDDTAGFGYLAEDLFTVGEAEAAEAAEVLEWLKIDRMRAALVKMVGQPYHMIYLDDGSRYLFAIYPEDNYISDEKYAGDIKSIYSSLSLIDNPLPPSYAAADDFYTVDYKDGAAIESYIGTALSVDVPEYIDGKPVLMIDEAAFYESNVQHIRLPDSVEEIGMSAFSGCNQLWTIELPASLRKIGYGAFESCFWLESVVLPNSVEEIGDSAFFGCLVMNNITLSENLRSIGMSAFALDNALESIILPKENKTFTVLDGVFYTSDMKELVLYPPNLKSETLIVPDGVEVLSPGALQVNYTLKEVVLPNTLKTIGGLALMGMFNLEKIVIPPSVTDLSNTQLMPNGNELTIYGDAGSAAEEYAAKYGITFALRD